MFSKFVCIFFPGYHGYTPQLASQLAPVSMPTLAALAPQFPQQLPLSVGQPAVMPSQTGAFHLSPLCGSAAISRASNHNGLQMALKSQLANYMSQGVVMDTPPGVGYQKRTLSLSLTSSLSSFPGKCSTAFGRGAKRKSDSRNVSPQQSDKSDSVADGNGRSQPLYCKICRVVLNAQLQARQHYEGKSHTKKMKMFTDSAATAPPSDGSGSAGASKDQVGGEMASIYHYFRCMLAIESDLFAINCRQLAVCFISALLRV